MLGCSCWIDEEFILDIFIRIKDNKIFDKEKIDVFMDFFFSRI